MALGQIFTIPNGTARLVVAQSHTEVPSVGVLNPNDGVAYLKLNGPAGPSPPEWDWKLPSQSYGYFPGPWTSLGIYFSDQSGSNRSGDINVYESQQQFADIPQIAAIGRAVAAVGTSVDIGQGVQPSNPPVSTGRLWIDGTGHLHVLQSNGTDYAVIDSSNIGAQSLGGDLAGTISNAFVNLRNNSGIFARDTANNAHGMLTLDSANNTVLQNAGNGGIFLKQQGGGLIKHWDTTGNEYNDAGAGWIMGAANASFAWYNNAVSTLMYLTSGGTLVLSIGPIQLANNLQINNDSAIFWNTRNFQIYPNNSGLNCNTNWLVSGCLSSGTVISGALGDISANRGNGTGYLFLGNASHYVGWDGSFYQMPTSGLVVGGDLGVGGGVNTRLASGGNLYLDAANAMQFVNHGSAILSIVHGNWANASSRCIIESPGSPQGGYGQLWAGVTVIQSSWTGGILFTNTGHAQLCGAGYFAACGDTVNHGQMLWVNGAAGGVAGWNVVSSERFKSNIALIDNALEIVKSDALHGHYYTMTPPPAMTEDGVEVYQQMPDERYGFIGEAWQEICPEVITETDGIVQMMDYGQVTPILFEAFKQYMEVTDARLSQLESASTS